MARHDPCDLVSTRRNRATAMLAATLVVFSLILSGGHPSSAYAQTEQRIQWGTREGPVSEPADLRDIVASDGVSLFVAFDIPKSTPDVPREFWKYSFSPESPGRGSWHRLADPPKSMRLEKTPLGPVHSKGFLYFIASSKSGGRRITRYDPSANKWETLGDLKGNETKFPSSLDCLVMDFVPAASGCCGPDDGGGWVRFDWTTRKLSSSATPEIEFPLPQFKWLDDRDSIMTNRLGVFYGLQKQKTVVDARSIAVCDANMQGAPPGEGIDLPWKDGTGAAVFFASRTISPGGSDELWVVRGSTADPTALDKHPKPSRDYARYSLGAGNAGWTAELLPDGASSNTTITLANGALFVRGKDDLWYFTRLEPWPNVFKVIVVNFDPVIEKEKGKRLHEVFGWNDPRKLTLWYSAAMKKSSFGWMEYSIVEWLDLDVFPVKTDGFAYDDDAYVNAMRKGGPFHDPDSVDYRKVIADYKLAEKVERGEADEVFMFGAPYMGYYESQMAGRGAYWCNSGGLPDVKCKRVFVIMGFNYERGDGEMLEDYGHRTESIMMRVYGGWNQNKPKTNWDLFTIVDRNVAGQSSCGNVHYAPNSDGDYDWGNKKKVMSTCDDWLLNWPNIKGVRRMVDCSEWGGGDMRLHHIWWFSHMPHRPGTNPDGKQNNWWKYTNLVHPDALPGK